MAGYEAVQQVHARMKPGMPVCLQQPDRCAGEHSDTDVHAWYNAKDNCAMVAPDSESDSPKSVADSVTSTGEALPFANLGRPLGPDPLRAADKGGRSFAPAVRRGRPSLEPNSDWGFGRPFMVRALLATVFIYIHA